MIVRWRDKSAVPSLTNDDGSKALCVEPRLYDETRTCTKRAVYPDHRCAIHTEWLAGTVESRKAADNGPRKGSAAYRVRALAWAAWREQQDPTLSVPKGNDP